MEIIYREKTWELFVGKNMEIICREEIWFSRKYEGHNFVVNFKI